MSKVKSGEATAAFPAAGESSSLAAIRLSLEDIRRRNEADPRLILQKITELAGVIREQTDGDESPEIHKAVLNALLAALSEIKLAATEERLHRTEEVELRREINEYYLREELVQAILHIGEIPRDPIETVVGVGFIDIADYSYISQWLSPKENQIVLNGLYSAFNQVLKRHGGYLNKTEGDSLLFHFGGSIDPRVQGLSQEEQENFLSTELFYTCLELQQACRLFNAADKGFIDRRSDPETKRNLETAFRIVANLRENLVFASSINAMFQIRVRVGAHVGEVCLGNFGPYGAKQWDIIGLPVIEAKRLEASAPVGGIRISDQLYGILERNGTATRYFDAFRKEAESRRGRFADIRKDELFRRGVVTIREKKNTQFTTYAVLNDPLLPETLVEQVGGLLENPIDGADRIVEILQYNRGSRLVVSAIEDFFRGRGIRLDLPGLYEAVFPRHYARILSACADDAGKAEAEVRKTCGLYEVFRGIGEYQDHFKNASKKDDAAAPKPFESYESYVREEIAAMEADFSRRRKKIDQESYFMHVVFPRVFGTIKAGILEYQNAPGAKESGQAAPIKA